MSSLIGQDPGNRADTLVLAEREIPGSAGWTEEQRRGAATVAAALIEDVPGSGHCTIGLGGAPGSGKSALARLVRAELERLGTRALVISLDDYYLGRRQREILSRDHPLWSQRGVPGTHDWDLLIGHLDGLRDGEVERILLPRFDKSRDDQRPAAEFGRIDVRPRVVIVEGWLIGAPPQPASALARPANRLEAEHDPDGRWRSLVNEQLARYHGDLLHRLHRRWFLAVPAWDSVVDWRWQQERERAESGVGLYLGDRDAVTEFLDHFQRISRHMLATCRAWADAVVDVDERHVLSIT